MADQSDVEVTLVSVISSCLYPNGTGQASAVGALCRVYRGWPSAAALDADLLSGAVHVTVFPEGGQARNTTRYPSEWQASAALPALTVTASGLSATFGGSAAPGQLAGLLIGSVGYLPRTYVHRTVDGDTPELVAATLAAAVNVDQMAFASGATVTVPGASSLVARTCTDVPALLEVRRQEQLFRITAWCPDPMLRDAVCSRVDATLAAARFLLFPDGSSGRHRWVRSLVLDRLDGVSLYRRDLIYAVDYPTTITAIQPEMLFGNLVLGGQTWTA